MRVTPWVSGEINSLQQIPPSSSSPPMAAASKAFTTALHLLSALSLAAAYFLARDVYSWTLATHPAETLRLLLVVEAPVVIGVYSSIRRDPDSCSYWKAAGRGIVGLPVGALLNAFAAIVLGAPVGTKYLMTTLNWSLLMSLFTFVPAACVFGSSSMDWQRYIGHSKPIDSVDYMIFLPSHGAIIGAWLGAWPMPLDWEKPWQEWPICVTYGAVGGYLVGIVASLLFTLAIRKEDRVKEE